MSDAGAARPLVVMPVYDDVDMLDVCGPAEMLGWAGIDVKIVAEKPGLVRFRDSFKFQVEHGFDAVGPCDAIWVPGGNPPALAAIAADPDGPYLDFVRRQGAQARFVCSVCEGAVLLAASGLLDGYEATTHWAFVKCFARYPQVKIVQGNPRIHRDRNRLTGGGISAGLDEALALIVLLRDEETAREVMRTTEYFPDPPVSTPFPKPLEVCPVPWVN